MFLSINLRSLILNAKKRWGASLEYLQPVYFVPNYAGFLNGLDDIGGGKFPVEVVFVPLNFYAVILHRMAASHNAFF